MQQLPKAQFEYVHHFIKEFTMGYDVQHIANQDSFFSKLKYSVDYNIIDAHLNDENNCHQGNVEYRVDVTFAKKKVVHLIIWGIFRAPLEMDKNAFIQMLYINGAPTISNIARSFVISATAHLSPSMCPIIIPMTNWNEFFENKFPQ